jgi:ankyrin repeat protein
MMHRLRTAVLVAAWAAVAAGCFRPPAITPLASAARAGDVAAIRAAAAAGRDLDVVDPGRNHWTPLLHAVHKGQRAAVEALIAGGADVHRESHGLSPLTMAVGNGQTDIVRVLLGAGAHPRTDGIGILALAVRGGALTDIENPLLGHCNTDIVRALIDRDPTLRLPRNVQGHLAVWFARLNHCREVIQLAKFS